MNQLSESPIVGIVVVGYNRLDSIKRLLERLNLCDYPTIEIPLIISLDNSGKNDLLLYAQNYTWLHGKKTVILQQARLGLRRHILHCGEYMDKYGWDAQIMLEDDVYPSIAFYSFAQQAVSKYQDDKRIAGISLYTMPQNQTAVLPFSPLPSPYDSFFMQLAQSWGQVWMKKQWRDFMSWYQESGDDIDHWRNVPDNVLRWPESSWLKYHICYCIDNNKFFVYPYQSLTTCFSDTGTHTETKSNVLQVPLQQHAKDHYDFPDIEDAVLYDAWSENMTLGEMLGIKAENICVDLYGKKKNRERKRYLLTMEALPYRVLRSFSLEMTPMEVNVLCELGGNDIFLYDTSYDGTPPRKQDADLRFWRYYNRIIYPDPIIRKLAAPIEKEVRKNRLKLLTKPKVLANKIIRRISK